MYDFQERMAEGRAAAKRQRDRSASSAFEVFANDRQRFAGMSDDDWHARCTDDESYAAEVGSAVDATDPVPRQSTEKAQTARRQTDSHPRPKRSQGMNERQYITACKKLDLSPGYSAAKALGISVTSAQRYRDGTWPIPETVAKLLRALVALGTTEI